MSTTEWSEIGVTGLPTGTVTLLLADVEGSTRLWETQPDVMAAAVARLDTALAELVAAHDGVRPVEQGEGDSFVIAFGRAADAVACALELQRAPLAPIRLRIGIHTGDVRLRDEANYVGPTINRTARLRDLAHGGQTVLSGTTDDLVAESLPDGAWLMDLGAHPLRDLARPQRVVQLCHPDLRNDFPPLRTASGIAAHHLPAQLTSFVGRREQIATLRNALAGNRLVTLTGAGGVGKTRLAVQVATSMAGEFEGGVWYVDLAPITAAEVVPVTVARALGLPDQPGRSTMDTLLRFVRERRMLIVLDNCEHLLDACATLLAALLAGAPQLTVLATSREPVNIPGEATWQVPSLSLDDEAVELFAERARLARPEFTVTADNSAQVAEICRRLDGMPLAIELAAARVRALSLTEIVDSLHDRFRLLTGGSRTAVRRQQTLRASVDWSHALLTETERVLFRRLAVFYGGFDLPAAQFVCGGDVIERYQVLDQLTLLVDKSLVVADNSSGHTRYRLLETVRQYALEKLSESGEADTVRSRHCDHYTAIAARLDAPARTDYEKRLDQAELEMDNLRNALGWDLETGATDRALALASALQPVWLTRGRIMEGAAWFRVIPTEGDNAISPAVRARALADEAVLNVFVGAGHSACAQRAVEIARTLDDPALLARALTACGLSAGTQYDPRTAATYYSEAIALARTLDDRWTLSQILAWQSNTGLNTGDLQAARAAGEEGRVIADAIGDRGNSRQCRLSIGWSLLVEGRIVQAISEFRTLVADCDEAHDHVSKPIAIMGLGMSLAYHGDFEESTAVADAALIAASDLGEYYLGMAHAQSSQVRVAAGDLAGACEAGEAAFQGMRESQPEVATAQRVFNTVQVALARGDVAKAREQVEAAISVAKGWHRVAALLTRARVAIAENMPVEAERDVHEALNCAVDKDVYLHVPEALECLAGLSVRTGSLTEAARLLGAAQELRERMGVVRFKIHEGEYQESVAVLRKAMDLSEFDAAWAQGTALSIEEAIAYAQRGRGQRKRPDSGWGSLTPAERDVARLVCEGMANKEIATRLFVSPRTVQAHLTHIYTKLGINSRVQLVQEAARHG
ncbi:LuxR family transcriptional regulator [Mycobacterium asiaticum]|uniref:Transcriptional regulator n=1 Tax=Mycobacterium asiaticum TaxID=1790 RepID=A0A1A3NP35_MYCAS|nr:LuxR family transcriptional regulator [Mycobacterium asiaticum]OBK23115.1 transcriptional regulator [Mycobacterium asiaticum]